MQTSISDLGDLRTSAGLRTIDASGLMAAPLWNPELREGDAVDLPRWSASPAEHVIAPGQPAEIVLLRPTANLPGPRYVVHLVIKEGRR
jgi:hypothetical protein